LVITTEVKTLIEQVPFVPITTVSGDGTPHLIVVGKVAEVRDDDVLAFGNDSGYPGIYSRWP